MVILHTNDVHGAIDGYAKMVALRESYEALGAEVITVDAGDFSQGDAYVNVSQGEDAITMMNAAGYTVSTLGNHEFDYGYEQLKKNLEKVEFTVICANIYENGVPILDPTYLWKRHVPHRDGRGAGAARTRCRSGDRAYASGRRR